MQNLKKCYRIYEINQMSRRASIILILLTGLSCLGASLSVFVGERSLALIDGPWITLLVDNQPYSLFLGIIPLKLVFLVVSLFATFMIAEFFGGKESIAVAVSAGLVIFLTGTCLKIIPFLPGTPEDVSGDALLTTLFKFNSPDLISQALQVTLGFSFIIIIYEILRRFTHNGFMIVRLFLASFIGLIVPPLIEASFLGLLQASFGKMISLLISHALQWNLLFFMLIPFYYLLYVPFRLLVGHEQRSEMKQRFQKKKIFMHPEKNFFEKREELQEKRIPENSLEKKMPTAVGEGGG